MASILVSNPKPSNNDSNQNLPHDITIDILTKLPVKSLLRFKSVCKSWYTSIKDDEFIKRHYDYTHKNCQKYFMVTSKRNMKNQFDFYPYIMDVPQIDCSSTASLVESPVPIDQLQTVFPDIQYFSSNGILLIICNDEIVVLWNPATGESRRIPRPIWSKHRGLYNFCYFPRIDEYKIFRLVNNDMNGVEIDVFSTKNNKWRSIGPFPANCCFFGDSVAMVDGVVYMTATRRKNNVTTILRFCLEKEQFQEELLDPHVMEGRRPILYCLGDKLCLTRTLESHEFWLYMMETNSWNKILTMPIHYNNWLKPLSFMKGGEMMFHKYNNTGFVAYNSTADKLEQVNVTGIEAGLYFHKVVNYVETFSSPNS